MDLHDIRTRSLPVAHLPVIRGIIDQLGIIEVLDDHLPRHALARVSDAECVVAMVLNILSGRMALWRMDRWLEGLDVELVLGEGVEAAAFHDTRLGQTLDRIDEAGTDRLLGDVVLRWLSRGVGDGAWSVHLDTTSVSVHGAYEADDPLTLTHGFSKDHRPDLKQLVFGLSLHGAAGVPLTMSVSSGNTSEQSSNRDHLAKLASLLPEEEQITLVADCKLVDATTLGQVLSSGFHLVSLVPKTFALRESLVRGAWAQRPALDDWPVLATRPGLKQADPPTLYRGWSVETAMPIDFGRAEDGAPNVSQEMMRLLVVHSDALAARFDASLEDRLSREVETLQRSRRQQLARGFACEADARKAAERVVGRLELHRATLEVRGEERRVKRPGPGRPAKGEQAQHETVWHVDIVLEPDAEAAEALRRQASCFVLITDWLGDEWDDARVLAEYRHQHVVEGHTGFRWLKGPAAVAPVLLNNPARIRALGLVLVLALMVRNHLQYTLRAAAEARGVGVLHPFRKRPDLKLTTEMALEWFSHVVVTFVSVGGGAWQRTRPGLCEEALDVLGLLELEAEIYARPPPRGARRKSRDGRGGTPGL